METDLIAGHLSCGPLLVLFSFIYLKYQPKEVNGIYGYRTKRSMKNQDVWLTANKISAKYMFQASVATTIFQGLGIFLGNNEPTYLLYSFAFLIIAIGISIWLTEVMLNQLFDKEGNRLKK
jgi:uncharacterized membrane protein